MKRESIYLLLIGALTATVLFLLWERNKATLPANPTIATEQTNENRPQKRKSEIERNKPSSRQSGNIDELTAAPVVVAYVKENGELPEYYITKGEARRQGWNAGAGNLCDVLPGRAIGGDVFTNRQRSLPTKSGRVYYEADLNYNCGRRNADRLVFSNDGLVFVTFDHYKTFEEK